MANIEYRLRRSVRAHCDDCEERFRQTADDTSVEPVWSIAARHAYATGHRVVASVRERAIVERTGVAATRRLPSHDVDIPAPPEWAGKLIGVQHGEGSPGD